MSSIAHTSQTLEESCRAAHREARAILSRMSPDALRRLFGLEPAAPPRPALPPPPTPKQERMP